MKHLLRIIIRRDTYPWWWVEVSDELEGIRSYMFTYIALSAFIRNRLRKYGGDDATSATAPASRSDEG